MQSLRNHKIEYVALNNFRLFYHSETPANIFGKFRNPYKGQYEQECNAEALQRLGVHVVKTVDSSFDTILRNWIDSSNVYRTDYVNNLPSIIESMLEIAVERK